MKHISNNKKIILTALLGLLAGLAISLISIEDAKPCTNVGDKCYELERVESSEDRRQGLSGRRSLASDEGMLFVFDSPGKQCMWMRGMNFPLDIIWLNNKGRVVDTKKNIPPESYPDNFCSKKDALYVIELNAGEIAESNLQAGGFVAW
jgi:hypothetical protein